MRSAAELGPDFVPQRAPRTHTVEIDGEAIVLDEEQNRLHLLNASATIAWMCCDGSGTLAEIATDLANAVGSPPDQLVAELVALARALGGEGLLDGVSPGPGPHGIEIAAVDVSGPTVI
jgi:hypothetical protein